MTAASTLVPQMGDPERAGGIALDRHQHLLPETQAIHLRRVEIDPASGEAVQRLAVEDPYFAKLRERVGPITYQDILDERDALQAEWDEYEAALRADPSPEMTARAQELIYDASPAMQAWRATHKEAKALYPLQNPDVPTLPSGEHIDSFAWQRFMYSLDAVGIRTRAVVTRSIFVEHAMTLDKKNVEWLSMGAGAAVPQYEGMQALRQAVPDTRVHVTAVDMSQDALDFAAQIAPDYGVDTEKDITYMKRHLIRHLMASDKLKEELGKKFDMVDLLGIFEYFRTPDSAALLLQKSYDLVADGGVLVFGNMLVDHPQLEINQRAVGWPDIKPRSIAEITEIVTKAGIDMKYVSIYIPEDSVYAVIRIEKPMPERDAEVVDLDAHRRRRGLNLGKLGVGVSHLLHRRNGHGVPDQLEEAA